MPQKGNAPKFIQLIKSTETIYVDCAGPQRPVSVTEKSVLADLRLDPKIHGVWLI